MHHVTARKLPTCPLVIPGNQLEISLQDGALAFRLHNDFEEVIEDALNRDDAAGEHTGSPDQRAQQANQGTKSAIEGFFFF